jgi:hypothetical protein
VTVKPLLQHPHRHRFELFACHDLLPLLIRFVPGYDISHLIFAKHLEVACVAVVYNLQSGIFGLGIYKALPRLTH